MVIMTSQECRPPFTFSVSLCIDSDKPLQIAHRHAGGGRCCLLKLLVFLAQKKRMTGMSSHYIYKILFKPLDSIFLKPNTGCRKPRNKPNLGSQCSPSVCAQKLLLFCFPHMGHPLHQQGTFQACG